MFKRQQTQDDENFLGKSLVCDVWPGLWSCLHFCQTLQLILMSLIFSFLHGQETGQPLVFCVFFQIWMDGMILA